MSKVNIVAEMLNSHSDEEIVEHLYRLIVDVDKNYVVALKANCPEAVWSNLGDVQQIKSILGAMYKRNQNRLAQTEA